MNRRLLLASLATLSFATVTPTASANFGVAGSVGTGFVRAGGGEFNRFATNIEIMPFYKIAIVSLDLGIKFNLESLAGQPRDLVFRPGARISIPVIPLYGRIAIPLEATNDGSYGLLVGLGFNMSLGPVGVFAEANVNLNSKPSFAETFPLEIRVGAQFSF